MENLWIPAADLSLPESRAPAQLLVSPGLYYESEHLDDVEDVLHGGAFLTVCAGTVGQVHGISQKPFPVPHALVLLRGLCMPPLGLLRGADSCRVTWHDRHCCPSPVAQLARLAPRQWHLCRNRYCAWPWSSHYHRSLQTSLPHPVTLMFTMPACLARQMLGCPGYEGVQKEG